jgi:hypothetical protein
MMTLLTRKNYVRFCWTIKIAAGQAPHQGNMTVATMAATVMAECVTEPGLAMMLAALHDESMLLWRIVTSQHPLSDAVGVRVLSSGRR